MAPKVLAHLSDLHLGRSVETDRAARRLCAELELSAIDHVVVTGDITHRGHCLDLEKFFDIFDPLIRAGRLSFIPGNHDRNGEDCGAELMGGRRVTTIERDGLHLVLVDSTGPHNRGVIASHGDLNHLMVDQIEQSVLGAAKDSLVAVLVHHHVLPLPVEGIGEWFAEQFGWPNAEELGLGRDLIARMLGHCDLILHGHRHIPKEFRFARDGRRPLTVYNAGSSTSLGRVRLFFHDAGRLLWEPVWLSAPRSTYVPASAAVVEAAI